MAGGPARDGASTAPWALALGGARAEEGPACREGGSGGLFTPPKERPQVPVCKVGAKSGFLYLLGWWGPRGDCKGLVGGDTWGRGWEGRGVVLDGGLTPGLPSKRKWDHAGGPDPIKGIHGQMDGQSDTKPASFSPASQP